MTCPSERLGAKEVRIAATVFTREICARISFKTGAQIGPCRHLLFPRPRPVLCLSLEAWDRRHPQTEVCPRAVPERSARTAHGIALAPAQRAVHLASGSACAATIVPPETCRDGPDQAMRTV